MVDRVLDKSFNPANWGLVSVVVSGATRQTLETIIDTLKERYGDIGGDAYSSPASVSSTINDALETTLRLAADDRGRGVLLDACSAFVSAAVGTYLDKTADSNTFDDFFAAALAASNRDAFSDMAGRVTGEAVRTVVEVVSPGMMSPRAPDADARSRARRRDGRRRGRDDSHASPGAAPASSVAREVFPESPRDVRAADAAFGTSADTETGPRLAVVIAVVFSRFRGSRHARRGVGFGGCGGAFHVRARQRSHPARVSRDDVRGRSPARNMAGGEGRARGARRRRARWCSRSGTASFSSRDEGSEKRRQRGVRRDGWIAASPSAAISVVFIVWLMAAHDGSVRRRGGGRQRVLGRRKGGGGGAMR